MFNFQKLDVYQKSLSLSIDLCVTASSFPYKYKRLQDQLVGSVSSICLNVAEGSGRKNSKEKIQFYRIAIASAFETVGNIEICHGLDLLNKNDWESRLEEICKMIQGLISHLNN